jgi:RecA-family ATPase
MNEVIRRVQDYSNVAKLQSSTGNATNAIIENIEFFDSEKLAKECVGLPALKRVWGNYIFESSLSIFGAERGSGKSYLMMQLCMAISGGWSHFLGEKIELHGSTIFIDFELGKRQNMQRLMHLYTSTNMSLDKTPFELAFPQHDISDYLDQIKKKIKESKPVLVVIDNLKTAFKQKDMQKGHEAIAVMSELKNMSSTLGFALVAVAHTKKNTRSLTTNSDLISGSGAISDLADGDFFLRKAEAVGERILKRDKSRLCEETDKANIVRMNPETRWFELVESNVDEINFLPLSDSERQKSDKVSDAKKMRDEGKTYQEIADSFNVNKSTVSRWLT